MSLVATYDVDDGRAAIEKKRKTGGGRRLRHSIYLGGKADAKDYDKLVHRWKITHVLNCTPPKQTNIEAGVPNYFEHKTTPSRTTALVYHRIPIYDSPTSLPDLRSKHEVTIVDFITRGLCHGNVLVHCSRGISRSTTSVVLYLMAKRNYRYGDALELIRRRRPEAQPIPAFDGWLKERDAFYYRSTHDREPATASASATTTTMTTMTTASSEETAGPPPGKKSKTAPSIGPVPPPKQAANRPCIGPALPPAVSGTAIGPEPPPKPEEGASATAAIGPEPPPPAVGEATTQPNPSPSIGPELPP